MAIGAVSLLASPAGAQWAVGGSGRAAGAATTMPAGDAPTASANGNSITLRWPAATFTGGGSVSGYVVNRYDAVNGSKATVGTACSGLVTTTTCTELSVPSGHWVYTDTPVQINWTGSESPASNPATVP
jgi:hypothetical protein